MALKRTHDWATVELHKFFLERAKMPFVWGSNDCALFAADAIQAMTGVDIAAPFRGKYTTRVGALAAIKSVTGGETVADAAAWCAAQHGLEELKYPKMAQRGDLVIVGDAEGDIAGIVHLTGRYVVSPGEKFVKLICISKVKRAWRV